MVVGVIVCSIAVGVYISRTGKYILFPTLGTCVFSVGSGLLILLDQNTTYGIEWIYLFVVGCGMGITFPVYTSIVQSSVPPKDMASSVAAVQFIRSIGGSVGVAIFATIINTETNRYMRKTSDYTYSYCKGLQAAFLAGLICSLISFVVAFGIQNDTIFVRPTKTTTTDDKTKGNNNQNGENGKCSRT